MLHPGFRKSEIQDHGHNHDRRAKNAQEDNRDDRNGESFTEISDPFKIDIVVFIAIDHDSVMSMQLFIELLMDPVGQTRARRYAGRGRSRDRR